MIVGVCGYGFSGSAAFLDLLKEYGECAYWGGDRTLELSFPYDTDGLLDLEYHLTKRPAKHLKGDNAISRYKQLVAWNKKSLNRATLGKYEEYTDDYLSSLIQVSYKCHSIMDTKHDAISLLTEKVLNVFQNKLETIFHRYIKVHKEETHYICVYPEHFLQETKKYIASVLNSIEYVGNGKMMLIDQPFPPNNPEDVFHFYEDPYAIVVNRDPRDIYVIVKHLRFSSARFIPHDTVEDFVEYYRNVVKHRPDSDSSRVLRVQFEDLIYEYESTVEKIESFLNISEHNQRRKIFNPDESIKNTNMRNLFPEDAKDMEYIEKELEKYLYPFEKYGIIPQRDGIFELAAR